MASPGGRRNAPEAPDECNGGPVPDLAGLTAIPEQLRQAFSEPYNPDRQPREGEIWRLEWQGVVAVAAVAAVTPDEVVVIPVGDDPAFADPATVVVEGDESPLGYPFGLWVSLEQVLPSIVLDLPVARIPDEERKLLHETRQALRVGTALPDDARLGPPLVDGTDMSDPRIIYRSELQRDVTALGEAFEFLARAHGDEGASLPNRPQHLQTLLSQAGLTGSDLAALLALSRRDLVALMRGQLALPPNDVVAVARLLGVEPEEVASAVVTTDPELIVILHEPRRRKQVRDKATKEQISETEARRLVVRTVAKAGRREQRGARTDWNAILDRYFAEDG